MKIDLEPLIHERLKPSCARLYADGHYREAAQLAMTVVELALKEKSGVTGDSGALLIDQLLGDKRSVKLRVPLGEHLQDDAWKLFRGAFAYYRNYATHDGSRFDAVTSLRVMLLASELLDLIGASRLSFAEIGGVDGLIRQGVFGDASSLRRLLSMLDGYQIIDNVVDGFYEDLAWKGYADLHVQALMDVGLLEYSPENILPTADTLRFDDNPPDEIGHFALPALARRLLGYLTDEGVPPKRPRTPPR